MRNVEAHASFTSATLMLSTVILTYPEPGITHNVQLDISCLQATDMVVADVVALLPMDNITARAFSVRDSQFSGDRLRQPTYCRSRQGGHRPGACCQVSRRHRHAVHLPELSERKQATTLSSLHIYMIAARKISLAIVNSERKIS